MIFLSPTSPVLVWVISLLKAGAIREQAQARMARTRRLDVHRLSDDEMRVWGAAATKSRGPN